MAIPHSRTNEEILDIAIAYVDEHGLEALTLRSLGEQLGMHHTAVYRYYANKADIVTAMLDHLIGQALDRVPANQESPREELLELARSLRSMVREHPAVMQAIPQITGTAPNALQSVVRTTTVFGDLGLSGEALVQWTRIYESYVVGASLYDFAGAPHHLSIRSARERATGIDVVAAAYRDDAAVDHVNETAFDRGLTILMQQAQAEARSAE